MRKNTAVMEPGGERHVALIASRESHQHSGHVQYLTALRREPCANGSFDKTIGLFARNFEQFRPPERHVIARNTVGPDHSIVAGALRREGTPFPPPRRPTQTSA